MCGFFAFYTGMSPLQLAELFGVSQLPRSEKDIEGWESLKYAPTSNIPTVSKNSPNKFVLRRWWLIPRWWKQDPYKIPFATFNARMEDITTKATYRTPWKQGQRCLIPITWFYEFETVEIPGEKKPLKIPYRIQVKDQEVSAIAGLYEIWYDAEKHPIESCTMITTSSVAPLNKIHHRQPVILPKAQWENWLDKETAPEDAYKMLKPWPGLEMFKIDSNFSKIKVSDLEISQINPLHD